MIGNKRSVQAVVMLLLIVACLLSPERSAQAQTPLFRLDIDELNLQMGVSTNLVLSMVDAKGAQLDKISGLDSFNVLSSSQSTSTRITGGQATYEESIHYVVMPKQEGQYTLRGSVTFKGSTYQTNELQIHVGPAKARAEGETEELFVKTILSDPDIYFGQKVVLAYELYTRVQIENFGFVDNPGIDGFISTDVPEKQLKSEIVYIDGVKYAKYEIKKSIITPVKTGTFAIPAYHVQVNVGSGGFFSTSKPVYLQTEAKELTVKPLKPDNQPNDFSGIVGNLSLESNYSKQEISYGDSVILRVAASSNGSLDSLKEVVQRDLPGFTVYQTEKSKEESIANNEYAMKKEFEVILVPKTNGALKIDPIPISYFNPDTGTYERAEIPGTTITVNGEGPQASAANSPGASAVETVRIDQVSYEPFRDGYVTVQFKWEHLRAGGTAAAIVLVLAAVAWFLLAYGKTYDRTLRIPYKKLMKSEDPHEIYQLFNSMMKEAFSISVKASSRQQVVNRLAGHDITGLVLEIMDAMESGSCHSAKGCSELKTRIKPIYKLLKKQRRKPYANQIVRFRTESDGSAVERG